MLSKHPLQQQPSFTFLLFTSSCCRCHRKGMDGLQGVQQCVKLKRSRGGDSLLCLRCRRNDKQYSPFTIVSLKPVLRFGTERAAPRMRLWYVENDFRLEGCTKYVLQAYPKTSFRSVQATVAKTLPCPSVNSSLCSTPFADQAHAPHGVRTTGNVFFFPPPISSGSFLLKRKRLPHRMRATSSVHGSGFKPKPMPLQKEV